MREDKSYWFPAKRYGWGWGLPIAWQGWVVLVVFSLAIVGGGLFFLPRYEAWVYVLYNAVATVLLMLVCWMRGEPPRWNWGGK